MFWQLVLAAAAVGALYYRWSRRRLYRLAEEIPSLTGWYPIIGHAHKFMGTNEDRMMALQECGRETNQRGGFTSGWLGNRFFLLTTDAEAIAAISKSCLDKDEFTMKFFRTVIGNGSIFAPLNIWHTRRKINAPFFSTRTLNHAVSVFDEKSTTMMNLMRAEVGGGDFPLWKYATTFTFDTICETATGTEIHSQENKGHVMLTAINVVLELLPQRMLQPWLHPKFVYERLPVYKLFQRELRRAETFIDEIIRRKKMQLDDPKAQNNYHGFGTNFLEMLLQPPGDGKRYSELELREELIVMIVGGNDTSAVALSFTAVLLSRYPDVQDKVHKELQEVFGDSDRAVTPEDMPRLKYLEAVIKESLRLYPPVPVIVREVHDDFVLPSGTTLVDGTAICINIWGAHRNPAYWGADADQFRPERFLQGALPHRAQFIPFSYSVRGCIGSKYGMLSAKTSLANLVRRYRLLPPAGARAADLTRPLRVKFDVTMKAVDYFALRIEERN